MAAVVVCERVVGRWICWSRIWRFCVALGAECGERNLGASLGAGDVTSPGTDPSTLAHRPLPVAECLPGYLGRFLGLGYCQRQSINTPTALDPEPCHFTQSSILIPASVSKSIMASCKANHGICLPPRQVFSGMLQNLAVHLHPS